MKTYAASVKEAKKKNISDYSYNSLNDRYSFTDIELGSVFKTEKARKR